MFKELVLWSWAALLWTLIWIVSGKSIFLHTLLEQCNNLWSSDAAVMLRFQHMKLLILLSICSSLALAPLLKHQGLGLQYCSLARDGSEGWPRLFHWSMDVLPKESPEYSMGKTLNSDCLQDLDFLWSMGCRAHGSRVLTPWDCFYIHWLVRPKAGHM